MMQSNWPAFFCTPRNRVDDHVNWNECVVRDNTGSIAGHEKLTSIKAYTFPDRPYFHDV
jgi:hypothetical protein